MINPAPPIDSESTYRPPIHQETDWTHPVDLIEPEDDPEHQPIDVAGIGKIPADAIRVFILMLLPAGVTPNLPSYWRSAACRLAALAHVLQIPGPGEMSLQQLGDALGCSRALLSLNQVGLRDFAKLGRLGGGKTNEARNHYSDSARRAWQKTDRKERHDSRTKPQEEAVAQ